MGAREGVRAELEVWDGGFFSHYVVLSSAIVIAQGKVLEMGCGWGSTPLVHYLSDDALTIDGDADWLARFECYRSPLHEFRSVEPTVAAWEKLAKKLAAEDHYGVVFLDQAPGEARVPCALALKDSADYIVCHDTCADNPGSGGNYGWRQLDGVFRYQRTMKRMKPWTTVYSNFKDFPIEACDA